MSKRNHGRVLAVGPGEVDPRAMSPGAVGGGAVKGSGVLFALRLARSTKEGARALAQSEGISLNQFIVLAVAEKIMRLESLTEGRKIQKPDVRANGAQNEPPGGTR